MDHNLGEWIGAGLRTIASSFPVASSIAAGWNEYKSITQANNIKDTLEEYAKKLSSLEQSCIDEDYLSGDELKALIWQVAVKVKDENIKEKRQFYADFLKNACTHSLSADAEKERVLETISKLTISDIESLIRGAKIINERRIENTNKIRKPKDNTWLYLQFEGDNGVSDGASDNCASNLAGIDYMITAGILELAIFRGLGLGYDTRALAITSLGWQVLKYLSE